MSDYFPQGFGLRDLLASQCSSPFLEDLSVLAGVKARDPKDDSFEWRAGVNVPADLPPTYAEWWRTLSIDERLRLVAEYKYRFADAMLRARNSPASPDGSSGSGETGEAR